MTIDWEAIAADQALTIALLESELATLKEQLSSHRVKVSELINQSIDAEQTRYCNLTNSTGQDYNDFIDCLENTKLTLIDDLKTADLI